MEVMLINTELAGKKVATEYGEITFDAKGECTSLTAEQEAKLGKLPGFSVKEEKKPAAKKPAPAKEETEKKPAAKKPAAKK